MEIVIELIFTIFVIIFGFLSLGILGLIVWDLVSEDDDDED